MTPAANGAPASNSLDRPNTTLVISGLYWCVLVAFAIWQRPPLPVDETRYLAVAWEMWLRDDFLVPYLNGEPYSHKPPLLFWLMHAGWALFGVNDWTPRLVAPLFGLVSLWLTWRLARDLWPDNAGPARLAPLILVGAVFWALFTTLTMFDMMLALFTLLGMIGLVRLWRGRFWTGVLIIGLALGGGALAKGPAILLHILPAALLAPLWAPRLIDVSSGQVRISWARWYGGVVLALIFGFAIGLAWALPAAKAGGEAYAEAIFWGQSAGRVVKAFAHARPWWWYLAVFPPLILPWLIWPAAWRAVRRTASGLLQDGGVRLCLIWAGTAFVVFSIISGKQLHYLLPEFPALALIFALALSRATSDAKDGGTGFWRRSDALVPALVFALIAIALILFFVLGLTPSWASTAGAATALPIAVLLIATGLYYRAPGSTVESRTVRLAAVPVVLVIAIHLAAQPVLAQAYDLRPFAESLKKLEDAGHRFAFLGKYHGTFTFLGRLETTVLPFNGSTAAKRWMAENPTGKLISYRKKNPPADSEGAELIHPYRSGFFTLWDAVKHRDAEPSWDRR